jgi:hypothetical protein
MSHSLCMIGVYDKVKMTVPMIVRYVHSDGKKNVTHRLAEPGRNLGCFQGH